MVPMSRRPPALGHGKRCAGRETGEEGQPAEIARLKRELKRVRMERDILKNHRGSVVRLRPEKRSRVVILGGGERPGSFWWRMTPEKTWPMGCCGLESGDAR